MTRFPPPVEKAYGLTLLAASALRASRPHSQDPNDPFLPSRHLITRPARTSSAIGDPFAIATWNIYEGRDPDILDGLECLLEDYCVDALMLQETPLDLLLHPRLEQYHLAYLPDNYEGAQPSGSYQGSFGNAILSPHAMSDVVALDLPIVSWDYWGRARPIRRNAIGARIAHDIDAWCTHLDLYCRPDDRLMQLHPALERIRSRGVPVALLGMDANNLLEPIAEEPILHRLRSEGFRDPWGEDRRPYPAYIDHALARGARPVHGEILDLPGSDHRAILASYRRPINRQE